MSLAEDLRRSYEPPAQRPNTIPLRKQLSEIQSKVGQPAMKEPRRDYRDERPEPPPSDTSLELLDKASKGVVFVLNRYKQLEDHVKQLDAWSKAQIQAAEAASLRWEDAAQAAERRIEDLQRSLEQMTRRAEAAEKVMNQDKEALTFLQDRIISAFGFGSDAHDAIKAVGLD